MTISEWQAMAEKRLQVSRDVDAAYDALLFASAVTKIPLSNLRLEGGRELTDDELHKLSSMLARRENGEPEQYIEGEAWFMGLPFNVDSRVLIPRQDTETLCEEALHAIKRTAKPRVLDLCTGSGALAVAVKVNRPDAEVCASDISPDAIDLAKGNAERHSADIAFIESDGMTDVPGVFDLIMCNPPYLTKEDMDALMREVRHEPALALYGGEDGLVLYRKFASEIAPHLSENGTALFEVGAGQAEDVKCIFKSVYPDAEISSVRDLNGIDRVVKIRR